MKFVGMTKNELEAYGRIVGIELDKRLTKPVLIEQLNDHLANTVDRYEFDDEIEDPVYQDAEIEEEDFPLMPPIEYEVEFSAIKEEPIDPVISLQAEKDARRAVHNHLEMVRQAEEKYQILKGKRVNAEVLELEALTEVEVARKNLSSIQKSWEVSKELL